MSLIRISIRNVTRNTRRSLITATAVLIGTLFIILARGILNGLQAQIVAGFTETQAGDVQLHRPDYLQATEALPLDKSFSISDAKPQADASAAGGAATGEAATAGAATGEAATAGGAATGEAATAGAATGEAATAGAATGEAAPAAPAADTIQAGAKFKEMMAKVDRVEAYTGRIQFSGLINNGLTHADSESTTLFFGQAVDPENEYKVAPRNKVRVVKGSPIDPKEPKGIVLGKALAEALNISVGNEVTLLVTTSKGSPSGMDVKVIGISDILLPGIGNKVVQIPLVTAQKLLDMENQVTEVLINVKDLEDVDRVNAQLGKLLDGEYKSLNLVPNTWKDIGKFYLDAIELQNTVLKYIVAVLFIVMIAGIVNTMLMSVFERVREIGTMMSIGVRRFKILGMFVFESAALGSLGAVGGVALGALIVTILENTGAKLPVPGGEWAVLYPYIRLPYMGMVIGVALAMAMLAALYPAWRASKLRPAEALRTL